jgi:hypothetical protein
MKSRNIARLAAFLLLLFPAIAQADAGVPMLALLWPALWVLFIPIVIIEAWIARRVVGLDWKTSLKKSGIANAVSTLIGIPLTWGVLVVIEIMLSQGGRAYGINTLSGKLIAVTVQAPWLIPYESDLGWMIPAASIVLLIPFFFVSVFVERWVFGRKTQIDKTKIKSWSWKANLLTYGLLQAVLVCLLIYGITKHNAATDKSQAISPMPSNEVGQSGRTK